MRASTRSLRGRGADGTEPIMCGFGQSGGNPVPRQERDWFVHVSFWKIRAGNLDRFHALEYTALGTHLPWRCQEIAFFWKAESPIPWHALGVTPCISTHLPWGSARGGRPPRFATPRWRTVP